MQWMTWRAWVGGPGAQEREHRAASVKLKETAAELEDLDCDKLKVGRCRLT